MKILIGIPVIYCEECVSDCLKSIKGQDADVLIIDNNSTSAIKQMIRSYNVIVNTENIYVNPAWNQIMKVFIESEYDVLIILNSDIILEKDSIANLKGLSIDDDKSIVLPNIGDLNINTGIKEIDGGFPGIMIVLTKKMCKLVYPIPESLKIWFGDDWIYKNLIKNGYTFRINYSIQAKHGGSRSIASVPEAGLIIEQDKLNWLIEQKKI